MKDDCSQTYNEEMTGVQLSTNESSETQQQNAGSIDADVLDPVVNMGEGNCNIANQQNQSQPQPQNQWQNQQQPQNQWQNQQQPQNQWQNQQQPQNQWQNQQQPQNQWQNQPQPQNQWQNQPQPQNQWQNQPQPQNQWQNQPQPQNQWQNQPQPQNQWQNQPQWQNGNSAYANQPLKPKKIYSRKFSATLLIVFALLALAAFFWEDLFEVESEVKSIWDDVKTYNYKTTGFGYALIVYFPLNLFLSLGFGLGGIFAPKSKLLFGSSLVCSLITIVLTMRAPSVIKEEYFSELGVSVRVMVSEGFMLALGLLVVYTLVLINALLKFKDGNCPNQYQR